MRKAQHSTRGFAVRFVDPWVAADRSTAFDAQLQEKKGAACWVGVCDE